MTDGVEESKILVGQVMLDDSPVRFAAKAVEYPEIDAMRTRA